MLFLKLNMKKDVKNKENKKITEKKYCKGNENVIFLLYTLQKTAVKKAIISDQDIALYVYTIKV